MISKKEFTDIFSRLQTTNELQEKVDELFRQSLDNMECDFMNAASFQISHEGIVIRLLNHIFYGTQIPKYSDIEYFIYELDYGKSYTPGCITENGIEVDISTADKLYDYLMKESTCKLEVHGYGDGAYFTKKEAQNE